METRFKQRLVLAGHVGFDVEVDRHGIARAEAGGFALHAARGVDAIGGKATILCTVGAALNPEIIATGDRERVQFVAKPTRRDAGSVRVFGPGLGAPPAGGFCSDDRAQPPLGAVRQSPFKDHHVHIGEVRVEFLQTVADALGSSNDYSVSCTWSDRYLGMPEPDLRAALGAFDLILFRYSDFVEARRTLGAAALCDNRLLVVECGERGLCGFVDGTCVIAAPPLGGRHGSPAPFDVFTGAFLADLTAYRQFTAAVLRAAAVVAGGGAPVHPIADAGPVLDPAQIPIFELADADCFDADASAEYRQIVDATGLFIIRNGKVLLVTKPVHKSLLPGRLYVPGGKMETGETVRQCAEREMEEETSLRGGAFLECGGFLFPDPRNRQRLYRFHEIIISNPSGDAVARHDIDDCRWYDLRHLPWRDLFPLAAAQLRLNEWLGLPKLAGSGSGVSSSWR